jgi:hypothetical protein
MFYKPIHLPSCYRKITLLLKKNLKNTKIKTFPLRKWEEGTDEKPFFSVALFLTSHDILSQLAI